MGEEGHRVFIENFTFDGFIVVSLLKMLYFCIHRRCSAQELGNAVPCFHEKFSPLITLLGFTIPEISYFCIRRRFSDQELGAPDRVFMKIVTFGSFITVFLSKMLDFLHSQKM